MIEIHHSWGHLGIDKKIGTNDSKLLVAGNEKGHPEIRSKLQHLSDSQTGLTGKGSPSSPE